MAKRNEYGQRKYSLPLRLAAGAVIGGLLGGLMLVGMGGDGSLWPNAWPGILGGAIGGALVGKFFKPDGQMHN